MSKFVAVYGAYGGLNAGDDLIGYEIARGMERRNQTVQLFGLRAHTTSISGRSCDFLGGFDLRRGVVSPLRSIKHSRGVVIGGGEQILETRVPNPVSGHLARCWHLSLACRIYGVPFCVLAVGINERISLVGRLILARVIKAASHFSVRDHGSFQRLAKWFPRLIHRVKESRDPVLSLAVPPGMPMEARSRRVLLIPCKDKDIELRYLSSLAMLATRLERKGYAVDFMGTCPRKGYDLSLIENSPISESSGYSWISPERWGMQGLVDEIRSSSCVLSLRMHGCIVAVAAGVPCVSVSRSEKMNSFVLQFPNIGSCSPEELESVDRQVQLVDQCVERKRATGSLYPELPRMIEMYERSLGSCVDALSS